MIINSQETPKPDEENGAPYVIYNKDGHHQQGPNSSNGQWGPGTSQNGYPALVSSQHEPAEQSTEQASQSTIASPLPSPYPNTNHSIQGSGNGGEDETPPEDNVVESDRTQPGHYGPADPSNYYSGVRGGPPHMLSPSSFMSYLKQPGVMLTPLNPAEASGDFPNMPDLIHQQQEASGKKGSDLRLFKCLSCGKDFKQKATLMQHERIHTDSRPFVCSDCGKRFRQQSHLTQHVRIHANEKPFVCVYCERTFRQRAILNQHLRIHSGEKPYGCGDCGKAFRQKAILNQHVRTHQGEHSHSSLNSSDSSSSPPPSQLHNNLNAFLKSSAEAFRMKYYPNLSDSAQDEQHLNNSNFRNVASRLLQNNLKIKQLNYSSYNSSSNSPKTSLNLFNIPSRSYPRTIVRTNIAHIRNEEGLPMRVVTEIEKK
ncbi:unnamed protein product [Macrosiphum euphorbiae]|uniref:C2H2-type domain-containing protein n=1 Tax=Macrosiphum euphorbiae TaxID=13131 RepID=A0AAV0VM52_9HEMI|nr:unnamed protein product [Macrosiphum euphorbiae]